MDFTNLFNCSHCEAWQLMADNRFNCSHCEAWQLMADNRLQNLTREGIYMPQP